MSTYNVLNLGAGVQSTTLYLMIHSGELDVQLDAAVFADTQDEPDAVYRHLEWLKSLGGPTIYVRTAGKLGDNLLNGVQPSQPRGCAHHDHYKHRFASIPAFTAAIEGMPLGIVKRQCTSEYKINVIEKFIRRELLNLPPYARVPAGTRVNQYIGFSFDEGGRAARTRKRESTWNRFMFPLIELEMTRGDCYRWLDNFNVPHETPRSACVFCPYKSNSEWRKLRDTDPSGWQRAVEIDRALRIDGNVVNRNLDQKLFVHHSCVPLEKANLHDDQPDLFQLDCESGMCGN